MESNQQHETLLCACSQTTLARLLSYVEFMKCVTLSSELDSSQGFRKITSLTLLMYKGWRCWGSDSESFGSQVKALFPITPAHCTCIWMTRRGGAGRGLRKAQALWKAGNLRHNFHFTSWLTTSKSENNSCILKSILCTVDIMNPMSRGWRQLR